MRTFIPIALVIIGALHPARAEVRRLTLAEAVALAMRTDPVLAEARVGKDRSHLAVLRAQLDRISLKIDGRLNEQWNKGNIGGAPIPVCTIGAVTESLDAASCATMGGTFSLAPDAAGQGLLNLSANLNVPVFAGFRVDANVKYAQRAEDAALVQIRQSQKDVALAVARAYWQVRRLGLALEVQNAALDRMKEAEAVAGARVKVGLAPPIDHNRAVQRRLQQVAAIEDSKGQLREASVQLAVSLGVTDELVLTDAPPLPPEVPSSVEGLLADARGDRPELKNAVLQLEMQHQRVRMARSGYYPQLSANALLQFGNNPYVPGAGASVTSSTANPFSNTLGVLTLGATLTMNFFDTLNTYTATRDAEYEMARLEGERRRFGRVVESDVRTAHERMRHLSAYRAPLQASREIARDNLKIIEGRYKNGEGTILDLFDAQLALSDAERQLSDVTAQLQEAYIELEAALGRVVGVAR
jgi:outer membrane protein